MTTSRNPRSAELHPGAGFRIRAGEVRVASDVVSALAAFPSPEVSDVLNRLYAVHPDICPLVYVLPGVALGYLHRIDRDASGSFRGSRPSCNIRLATSRQAAEPHRGPQLPRS